MKRVLLSQQYPSSSKSPFFLLEKNYKIKFTFQSFTNILPINPINFLKQNIHIEDYTCVYFQNKNVINQYFNLFKELHLNINSEIFSICNDENTALHLKNFIPYKKRRVFFGDLNSNDELLKSIKKINPDKILYPSSEYYNQEVINYFKNNNISCTHLKIYSIECIDLKKNLDIDIYHGICFLTAASVDSFFKSYPDYKKLKSKVFFCYGRKTKQQISTYQYDIDYAIPSESYPSISKAIEHYLTHY